jgi:hypothetical protein
MSEGWASLIKQIIEYAINPLYSFVIWVGCLIVLVLPLPDFLQLELWRKTYAGFFGLGLIFGLLLWASTLGLGLLNEYNKRRKILIYLDSLNTREAYLLATAVKRDHQTIVWQPGTEETTGLVHKGLLEDVTGQHAYPNQPFNIPTFVWKEIKKPARISTLTERSK